MKPKSLVTLATAGITLFGAGFWWGANLAFKREESKNLEQIISPQEVAPPVREFYNNDLSEEEKTRKFYVSALETLDNVSNRMLNFYNNLNYYKKDESKTGFLYLAQAKENLLIVGQDISLLQHRANVNPFISNKFVQNLYNLKYNYEEFNRNYLDELENVFTPEGVSEYKVDVEKFYVDKNKNAKDLERELSASIKFAEGKIEDR